VPRIKGICPYQDGSAHSEHYLSILSAHFHNHNETGLRTE
jgi:hypothetical protein